MGFFLYFVNTHTHTTECCAIMEENRKHFVDTLETKPSLSGEMFPQEQLCEYICYLYKSGVSGFKISHFNIKKLKFTFELAINSLCGFLLAHCYCFQWKAKKKVVFSSGLDLKYLRTWKGHKILLLRAYNTFCLWTWTSLFWQLCYTSASQEDDIQVKSKSFLERINPQLLIILIPHWGFI